MHATGRLRTRYGTKKALWLFVSSAALLTAGSLFLKNSNIAMAVATGPVATATQHVWSAKAGFCNEQGGNNWYYQEWTGSTCNAMTFVPSLKLWRGTHAFCEIGEYWQHPGASCDSVRVWIAPENCTIQITGNVCKMDCEGDGVRAVVLRNSTVLWGPRDVAADDRTGYLIDVTTNVAVGDSICFRLNCRGVPDGDTTYWDPIIRVVVEPRFWQSQWFLTILVLFSGGLGLTGSAIAWFLHLRHRRQIAQIGLQLACNAERSRIAQDMHDEMGAKLGRMSFLSDLAADNLSGAPEALRQIGAVSDLARDILRTMDEMIWAANPRNDTVESLVYFICRHAEEFLELTPLELDLVLPVEFPSHQLSAETRHHLFCAVKELLNNALKHSGASKVRIAFVVTSTSFQVAVSDNGCGFCAVDQGSARSLAKEGQKARTDEMTQNAGLPSTRNGLVNVRARLDKIHGTCEFQTQAGQGTCVTLTVFWGIRMRR